MTVTLALAPSSAATRSTTSCSSSPSGESAPPASFRLANGVRLDPREHARRRSAHAEQAALALGQHVEGDRVAVEARVEPLELAHRLPLRLADRLARGFDLEDGVLCAHRLPPRFFFRFTRRGWDGWDCGPSRAPAPRVPRRPSPHPLSQPAGGVRELFFCGATFVRGTSRRVTMPCPTVQRFVVAQ